MSQLSLLGDFDSELNSFLEGELQLHKQSLSFIPDENSTSPLCAQIIGNILVNDISRGRDDRSHGLEALTVKRLCKLFNADHANVRTTTIEAASRVVFQAVTKRGDVVMSLDLRKKEHCNSEELAFRFINFGLDPQTQSLDYDALEQQARQTQPKLIIVSPINYPLAIDYARLGDIAHSVGALLWCDISQIAGLVAAGELGCPFPHADVVTFTVYGALQGPHTSAILCTNDLANAIDRVVNTSGHKGLLIAELSALAARIKELSSSVYKKYARIVIENAQALAEGLQQGGASIISQGTQSHLVMIDTKKCALAARGAQEVLAQAGCRVRTSTLMTSDNTVKFDVVRFSSLPATTRGITAMEMHSLGQAIGALLQNPDDSHVKVLADLVATVTSKLCDFSSQWMIQK